MLIKRTRPIYIVFLIIVLTGCSSGISKQSLSKVTYMGSFSELQENPDQFIDEIVLFGGKIIEAKITPTSSELIVLHMPLDNRSRPENLDQSKGRFLIRSEQFLDPAIYQKGVLLSTVGVIKGSQAKAIGGFSYVYPLMETIEIKLWPKEVQGYPWVHFGFGVGTTF
ncbi:MAG: Slp family lipoprotein [Desulfobacterales bacterium]|nr:MAG: Slp family lipoprotein [Desulfobacterales bacterium]